MLNHIISLYCLASATSESKDPVAGSESVIPTEHQTVEDQAVHHRKVGHQTVAIQSVPTKETKCEGSGTKIMIHNVHDYKIMLINYMVIM